MSYIFACVGLPTCIMISLYQGEFSQVFNVFFNPYTFNRGLAVCAILSGLFGISIEFSHNLAASLCGPFATTLSSCMKDAVLTYIGFIFFSDLEPTDAVMLGLALSFSGSAYYTFQKYD